jgi:hypothetical protein
MPTTMPEPIPEQIIADKIKEWEQKKQELKAKKDVKEIKTHPFLTIARDFGCREEEIIPDLEKSLEWKVYGRNMLDHLARKENLSRSFLETLDEHRQNLIENWVNFLIHSGSIMQDDYLVKISRLIKVIVAQENAIFLGRGINYILADKREGLRIRLTAPLTQRIKNISKHRNISEKEAKDLIQKTDQERREFIKQYFNKDFDSCEGYDLVFNTMNFPSEKIFKTISLFLNG